MTAPIAAIAFPLMMAGLAVFGILGMLASMSLGALSFPPDRIAHFIAEDLGWVQPPVSPSLDHAIFVTLRLPRVAMVALTGAILATSGALMQGMFRNPIVEPGLAGTSAGAALGAALAIVMGWVPWALPLTAFCGGILATVLVLMLAPAASSQRAVQVLLAGIAVNALCQAGVGYLGYIARDPQARSLMFWSMGSFTTATWASVAPVAVAFALAFPWAMREAKSLNALSLGEVDAGYLGIDANGLLRRLLVVNTLMVALASAYVGVIAFIGLIVPQGLRRVVGADHQRLLPASALCGAALLEYVDLAARLIIPPAELPIGILTALIGAPIFLVLLAQTQARGLMP